MTQYIDLWKTQPFTHIVNKIKEKKVLPFIGPEVCQPWIPRGQDIASKWAIENNYPLEDSYQLSRVAQFLAIEYNDNAYPKKKLKSEIESISPPNFSIEQLRNEPLAVLADLNLPVYITTNYDHFLEEALKSKGKIPISDFCRWSKELKEYADDYEINSNLYNKDRGLQITSATPLVFHLFGDMIHPLSMVLTEKDFIDYMLFLNQQNKTRVLPLEIRKKINSEPPLFIGYPLYDKSFFMIFQTIINSDKTYPQPVGISVGIELMPLYYNNKINVEKVREYFEKYTKEMFKLNVFPGSAKKFSEELREELARLDTNI
jgi:SIR2-like domain